MTTDDLVQRMVERGARDLQDFVRWHDIRGERLAVPGLNDWDALMPSSKGGFQAATRAALLAALEEMREVEPTDEMMEAGAREDVDVCYEAKCGHSEIEDCEERPTDQCGLVAAHLIDDSPVKVYRAMIGHLIERLKA